MIKYIFRTKEIEAANLTPDQFLADWSHCSIYYFDDLVILKIDDADEQKFLSNLSVSPSAVDRISSDTALSLEERIAVLITQNELLSSLVESQQTNVDVSKSV